MGRRRMQVWSAVSSWGSLCPSRKKCPLVCDWVGLKAGAFLELEPLLGSLWPVSGT